MKLHSNQNSSFKQIQHLIQTQVAILTFKICGVIMSLIGLTYLITHLKTLAIWLATNHIMSVVMMGLSGILIGLIIYDCYRHLQIKHYHHLIKLSLILGLLILSGTIIIIGVPHLSRIMDYVATNAIIQHMMPWLIFILCGLIGYDVYLKSQAKK